jgi:5S rRNA maturation endonuclease (ribonuclease M5)
MKTTQMTIKKKYHSYDQSQLKYISDALCDNIEELLAILGVESYKLMDKMVSMSCPIHGGDNDSACNLYHQGDSYRGNWKCRTHQCEETFKSSIIGFIRGCLSHNEHNWSSPGDKLCSFQEAVDFASSFLKQDISEIKVCKKQKEKNIFVNSIKYINTEVIDNSPRVTKELIKKSLDIPSTYFISRGFSPGVLKTYDVGECSNPNKEMYNRAVVPVYDMENSYMVGCSGRSIFEKCPKCSSFHDPAQECPPEEKLWLHSKWRHSSGFKTQEHLYNFCRAKEKIKSSSSVILVESPGNVWRLEESGINNSVAVFGASLSDRQKMILDTSGAMTIVVMMDNDSAGQKAAEQIYKKCEKTYNIKTIKINHDDIGSMTVEQVTQEITPLIKDYI